MDVTYLWPPWMTGRYHPTTLGRRAQAPAAHVPSIGRRGAISNPGHGRRAPVVVAVSTLPLHLLLNSSAVLYYARSYMSLTHRMVAHCNSMDQAFLHEGVLASDDGHGRKGILGELPDGCAPDVDEGCALYGHS